MGPPWEKRRGEASRLQSHAQFKQSRARVLLRTLVSLPQGTALFYPLPRTCPSPQHSRKRSLPGLGQSILASLPSQERGLNPTLPRTRVRRPHTPADKKSKRVRNPRGHTTKVSLLEMVAFTVRNLPRKGGGKSDESSRSPVSQQTVNKETPSPMARTTLAADATRYSLTMSPSHLHLRLHFGRHLGFVDENSCLALRDQKIRYCHWRVRNVVSTDVEDVSYLQSRR